MLILLFHQTTVLTTSVHAKNDQTLCMASRYFSPFMGTNAPPFPRHQSIRNIIFEWSLMQVFRPQSFSLRKLTTQLPPPKVRIFLITDS
jgi:hypothetical protein